MLCIPSSPACEHMIWGRESNDQIIIVQVYNIRTQSKLHKTRGFLMLYVFYITTTPYPTVYINRKELFITRAITFTHQNHNWLRGCVNAQMRII